MGCTSSKAFKGEGHRLGSVQTAPAAAPPNGGQRITPTTAVSTPPATKPTRKTGGTGPGDNVRSAAARAAEQRADSQARRGTNTANPNAGKLSDKLQEQNRKATLPPESNRDKRLTWD